MFPPNSLLDVPCPPKSFDFHTVTKRDLEEFTVPIQFVVQRTALIHGVSFAHSYHILSSLTCQCPFQSLLPLSPYLPILRTRRGVKVVKSVCLELMIQLASWFDLDFFPRTTLIPQHAIDDPSITEKWEYSIMPKPPTWPWMSNIDNGLNPVEMPVPPERGLPVRLSTGPSGEFWCQAAE